MFTVPTHPFFIDPDKYQSSNSVDSTGYKSQLGSGSQALNSVPSLAGVDTSSHSDQARRAKSAEASTSTSALDQSQHSKSRKTMRVIQSRNDCNSEVVVDRIERDDSDSDVMEYGLRNSEAREKSKKIKKYHN